MTALPASDVRESSLCWAITASTPLVYRRNLMNSRAVLRGRRGLSGASEGCNRTVPTRVDYYHCLKEIRAFLPPPLSCPSINWTNLKNVPILNVSSSTRWKLYQKKSLATCLFARWMNNARVFLKFLTSSHLVRIYGELIKFCSSLLSDSESMLILL